MLKMNDDMEGALIAYLILLDKEAYFEAHEVLEEVWHPLRKRDQPFKKFA
jgi:hypothetical protein